MRSLHLTFHWHYIGRSKVKTSQDFVAFSEYMTLNRSPVGGATDANGAASAAEMAGMNEQPRLN